MSDRLGWSTAKKDQLVLEASTDDSSTATLDSGFQYGKISRISNKQLKVLIFAHKDDLAASGRIWNIRNESGIELRADSEYEEQLIFSEKTGLLIYTAIHDVDDISSNDLFGPTQESYLFSCTLIN